jgi:hypothetical protein
VGHGTPYSVVDHLIGEDLSDIYLGSIGEFNAKQLNTADGLPHSDETFRLTEGVSRVIMLYAIADKPDAMCFHRYGYLSLAARCAASSIVTTLGPSPAL